ncbi:hypothetical protein H2203_006994 [Taxawa tesnikishii (nom. ined.)]|nr:hypothetical protein H2203_006994 [Dothideales sp. JES 119]
MSSPPPHHPTSVNNTHPLAGQPTRAHFDPWNSSSTGHQRADNRLSGSTSWRQSRSLKLSSQFGGGLSGGKRVADTVGAGSEDFGKDDRLANGGWAKVESYGEFWGAARVKKEGVTNGDLDEKKKKGLEGHDRDNGAFGDDSALGVTQNRFEESKRIESQKEVLQEGELHPPTSKTPQVFAGLTIYINGSTAPTISDYKLKHLLVSHGANISIALGRRSVTHVILGRPNGSAQGSGAGGGLSSSKIQKEIARVGGKSVKFVSVEWVIECVKVGKKVSEARAEGVGSVAGMFAKAGKKNEKDGG